MPGTSELIDFRRAFVWLLCGMLLPSVALVAFGVVAVVNERVAVERRLETQYSARLRTLDLDVRGRLDAAAANALARAMADPAHRAARVSGARELRAKNALTAGHVEPPGAAKRGVPKKGDQRAGGGNSTGGGAGTAANGSDSVGGGGAGGAAKGGDAVGGGGGGAADGVEWVGGGAAGGAAEGGVAGG